MPESNKFLPRPNQKLTTSAHRMDVESARGLWKYFGKQLVLRKLIGTVFIEMAKMMRHPAIALRGSYSAFIS
jgi:hypothetical protein